MIPVIWARAASGALPNDKMQLTSGGLYGALRAPSLSRRLQLILVLAGRVTEAGQHDANSER
jgi:hypothetical protein